MRILRSKARLHYSHRLFEMTTMCVILYGGSELTMKNEEIYAAALENVVRNGYRGVDGECDCINCTILSIGFCKAFWGYGEAGITRHYPD